MTDLVVVAICAAVWWIPTFVGIADLQKRPGLRRPVVWKWWAVLAIPVVGAAAYFWRGRQTLDAGGPKT